MAAKYLSEPGSYLVTLYHPDFRYLGILVTAFSDLLTASCVCYTARDHFLFPTLCVSFGKFMVSKRNQLGKDSRPLKRPWSTCVDPLHNSTTEKVVLQSWKSFYFQDESAHNLFLGIRSPPLTHPRCETPDTSWTFDLRQNPVFWWLQWEKICSFHDTLHTWSFGASKTQSFVTFLLWANSMFPEHWKHRADWMPNWVLCHTVVQSFPFQCWLP